MTICSASACIAALTRWTEAVPAPVARATSPAGNQAGRAVGPIFAPKALDLPDAQAQLAGDLGLRKLSSLQTLQSGQAGHFENRHREKLHEGPFAMGTSLLSPKGDLSNESRYLPGSS